MTQQTSSASAETTPADTPTSRASVLLHRVFGFSHFRVQQEEIIDHLVDGGDALVLMPTGGGKSLCYQIPAMLRDGTAVVVSPLIALMQDQVDGLRQSGVRAAVLNSTLSAGEARQVEDATVEVVGCLRPVPAKLDRLARVAACVLKV